MSEQQETNKTKNKPVESLAEYLEVIDNLQGMSFVFRGHGKSGYEKVASGAYRRLSKELENEVVNEDFIEYNKNLIKDAKSYSQEISQAKSDLAVLSELQHYGAATCLLDFTNNALVALWFACTNLEEEGEIFCLNRDTADSFISVNNVEGEGIDTILEKKVTNKIGIWEPSISNNRIIKQDSVFLLTNTGYISRDEFYAIIPVANKKAIFDSLQKATGFSPVKIYPDFYGFASNNNVKTPLVPSSEKEIFEMAWEHNNKGEYKKAIDAYTQVINLDPENVGAYNNRGIMYKELGEYEKAIEDYNKAIKLNPRYANAYNNRGIAYSNLGAHEKAIEDYNKAIELNPKDADAYNNRGIAYRKLGEYKKAIEDYNKAIELNPKDADAYINRGNAYSNLGAHEKAIEDYNKAIELDPQHALAYNNRGNSYHNLGEYKQAIENYNKAIELNLKDASAYINLGVISLIQEDIEGAIQHFTQAKNLEHESAHLYLGIMHAKQGYYEKSITAFDAINDIDNLVKTQGLSSKERALYQEITTNLQQELEQNTDTENTHTIQEIIEVMGKLLEHAE